MKHAAFPALLPSLSDSAAAPKTPTLLRAGAWFVGDWTDMLFVHFSLPARELAPHAPFTLDLFEGEAFVSLVLFKLQRMRPARLGELGRLLFRPVSDHWFLNVRTYVQGPAGPGIQFLCEWIPNPLALHLGPLAYGLPYRRATFDVRRHGRDREAITTEVRGSAEHTNLRMEFAARDVPSEPCTPFTVNEFLLERYTAYTHRRGRERFFRVAHAPWNVTPAHNRHLDTSLVSQVFPWFKNARYHSAHVTPGVRDVLMGPPRPCVRHSFADVGSISANAI